MINLNFTNKKNFIKLIIINFNSDSQKLTFNIIYNICFLNNKSKYLIN
jgi:hypothetical protein